MAEYLIQDTTLSDIGDKIRILTGTEETMTPAEMIDSLDTFNREINEIITEQDNKIALITEALEGKMVPSGGGDTKHIVILVGSPDNWCDAEYVSVSYNGKSYPTKDISFGAYQFFEVNDGDTVIVTVDESKQASSYGSYMVVDDTDIPVPSGEKVSYEYTVHSNTGIYGGDNSYGYEMIVYGNMSEFISQYG